MSGPALAATTGLAAGVLLLGSAAAGFHDLASIRRARQPGPASRENPMIMSQGGSPMTSFRPFFNPATGEWIEYTAIAEDSDGQLVRFNWRSVPGGVIPEHIHPRQDEQFTILAGEAHFTVAGKDHVAGAGQTIVVPAGVPHSVANPGPAQIDGIVERRPALQAKEFHEAVAGLVADGKTTPTGAPKNPLQLGATFWEDYLTLGVTEIREYGSTSIQVIRRMRAMLEELRDGVCAEHRPAVEEELARLHTTVARAFAGSVDLDRANTADPQGIGGRTEPPGPSAITG
jgi:mannose-6-phosphate isomerase-like protein (cupin superfamily)